MAANERTLTEEQLATISGNMLHQTLIDVSRTVGKRIFRELESGTRIARHPVAHGGRESGAPRPES